MSSLGSYLKGEGFAVDDDAPLGREAAWDRVEWLFVHHTADSCDPDDAPARARYIRTAEGRYPPLAQIMVGRDQRIWICSRQRDGQAEPGRASHAGEGSYPGIPRDTANEVALGVEVQCSGAHELAKHADSYQLTIRLLASLLRRYDLDVDRVIGHKEYSSTGKIDPRDSMKTIRADVRDELEGDEGSMKHTIAVSDLDQPLVVPAGGRGFVDFRDVDEDDEDLYGDLSIIPDRYIDFDTSGWIHTSGPCQLRVARWSEGGDDWEATYSVADVEGGYVPFAAQGGAKAKTRLRIQIDAGEGSVTVSDGRWIVRYRDHVS